MRLSSRYRVIPLLSLSACGACGPSVSAPATAAVISASSSTSALAPASYASSASAAATPVLDGSFDVGGLSLHIHCVGEGTPVVVLESGLGDDATSWSDIQPEVARFTRVCAYDRAGTGSSSPAPRPHSSRQMVSELHALLQKAGVQSPYVLVGHSLGGLNIRLFASDHTDEVSGMVLVDSATENQDTRCWGLIPEEAMRGFRESLATHPEGLDYEHFRASMADVRASKHSFGDLPLVVLSHGVDGPAPPGASPALVAKIERAFRDEQAALPGLSGNSVHVIAEHAGHYIHRGAPGLVAASIREVVKAARAHARVDPKPIVVLAAEAPP